MFLDEESGDIIIGGHAMGATRKFRNVQANAHVALVIDDLVSTDPWTVPFMSREVIRITPTWVTTWGLDEDANGRQSRRGS